MKKLFSMILVLGLLLSGNAYAGLLDIFKSSNMIIFEKCHSNEFTSIKDADLFDEYSFEIDKDKEAVIRTTIWNDKSMKEFAKDNPRKISQDTYKLKSIGNRFISTDFPNIYSAIEFVFDLENKTIQTSVRTRSDIHQYTMQCY